MDSLADGGQADAPNYKPHTRAYVCIVLRKGCPPVRCQPARPSMFIVSAVAVGQASASAH